MNEKAELIENIDERYAIIKWQGLYYPVILYAKISLERIVFGFFKAKQILRRFVLSDLIVETNICFTSHNEAKEYFKRGFRDIPDNILVEP